MIFQVTVAVLIHRITFAKRILNSHLKIYLTASKMCCKINNKFSHFLLKRYLKFHVRTKQNSVFLYQILRKKDPKFVFFRAKFLLNTKINIDFESQFHSN